MAHNGMKCYNNGIVNKYFKVDDIIPEGFKPGSKPFTEDHLRKVNQSRLKATAVAMSVNKGKKVFTNGSVDIRLSNGEPIPEGFYLGSRSKGKPHNVSEEGKAAQRAADIKRKGKPSWNKGLKGAQHWVPGQVERFNTTKRQNHTFNTSKAEEALYTKLVSLFGEAAVARQYKSAEYPFACDFYIKPLDLYVELNLNWTHGDHPFDINNRKDLDRLEELKTKAITSQFYANAINTWTQRDAIKLKALLDNKLNYLLIYPTEIFSSSTVSKELRSKICE